MTISYIYPFWVHLIPSVFTPIKPIIPNKATYVLLEMHSDWPCLLWEDEFYSNIKCIVKPHPWSHLAWWIHTTGTPICLTPLLFSLVLQARSLHFLHSFAFMIIAPMCSQQSYSTDLPIFKQPKAFFLLFSWKWLDFPPNIFQGLFIYIF